MKKLLILTSKVSRETNFLRFSANASLGQSHSTPTNVSRETKTDAVPKKGSGKTKNRCYATNVSHETQKN